MHSFKYFDFEFSSWGGNGGSFSYTRNEFAFGLVHSVLDESHTDSGTTLPTQTSDVVIPFDATNLVAGDYLGVVKISSNDPNNPIIYVEVIITVTGGVPEVTADASLDFLDYFVGSTTTQTIAIENTGTGFLNISDITSDDVAFAPLTTTATIAPGEFYDLEISFSPDAVQAYNGTLSIVSDDPATPFDISLSGNGENPPGISISAASFTQALTAGMTNDQLLNITNTGDNDLEYTVTVDLGMSDPVNMKKRYHADWTLPENIDIISPDIWLTRAEGAGFFNTQVETFHEDDQTAPIGTEWTWAPTLNANSSDYEAIFSSPPDESWAAFGDLTHSLHILNEDRYFDLMYTSFNYSNYDEYGGAFAYSRTEIYHWLKLTDSTEPFTYSSTVASGNNEDVTLMFKTDGMPDGQYQGTLTLTTNVPGSEVIEIPLDLTISGNTPDASIHEVDLDFSDTGTDATTSGSFRVINNGLAPLNVTNITSDNAFFVINNTSFAIDPLSYAIVEVGFSPSGIQAFAGTITVTTNDAGNPTPTITVAGNGIDV